MKYKNIDSLLVKNKMTGFEVGRIMIQGYLFMHKQILNNQKDKPKPLLSDQEIAHLQAQLVSLEDVRMYNAFLRLWHHISIFNSDILLAAKSLEVCVLQLYILLKNEGSNESVQVTSDGITFPSNAEKRTESNRNVAFNLQTLIGIKLDAVTLTIEFYKDILDLLKKWYVMEAVFSIIAERIDLPDLMLLIGETPDRLVDLSNVLLTDYFYLYPDSDISRAFFSQGIIRQCKEKVFTEMDRLIDPHKIKPSKESVGKAKTLIQDLTFFSKDIDLREKIY